jgi:hypothetical protein
VIVKNGVHGYISTGLLRPGGSIELGSHKISFDSTWRFLSYFIDNLRLKSAT